MNTIHPKGLSARVLLTSVFGPYAQDDEYGSRKINPMELYHNQVTRVQGPFSPRSFHRSFNLMFLQANIDAPCVLLDFPTLECFTDEIRNNEYDIIGISSIMPNVGKVKKMCEVIRRIKPEAVIVVGGHVANMPNIRALVDADHIVNGEGVRWFRHFLGQNEQAPMRHPLAYTSFGMRVFGTKIADAEKDAATLIPSVGCPMGCNFCSTSHMFGGKGKSLNFYESGDDLFRIMCSLEEKLNVQSFGVMDENFLLHKKRALRLLELMEKHGKSWSLSVFTSAQVLRSYTMDQIVGLGVSWVWIGLEGKESAYDKLHGIDTRKLVKELQSHGIRILGSTIIGLESHVPEKMDEVIDWAVSHDTDFHQFMLYTCLPGTPLFLKHRSDGTLMSEIEIPYADVHGQLRFNHRHPHIRDGRETDFLLRGFQKDFETNGPSIARMIRTTFQGWKRYRNFPCLRIRERFRREEKMLSTVSAGIIWAVRHWYRNQKTVFDKMNALYKELCSEFGWKTRLSAPIIGSAIAVAIKAEAARLKRGITYEPETFYEMNDAAWNLFGGVKRRISSKLKPRLIEFVYP